MSHSFSFCILSSGEIPVSQIPTFNYAMLASLAPEWPFTHLSMGCRYIASRRHITQQLFLLVSLFFSLPSSAESSSCTLWQYSLICVAARLGSAKAAALYPPSGFLV